MPTSSACQALVWNCKYSTSYKSLFLKQWSYPASTHRSHSLNRSVHIDHIHNCKQTIPTTSIRMTVFSSHTVGSQTFPNNSSILITNLSARRSIRTSIYHKTSTHWHTSTCFLHKPRQLKTPSSPSVPIMIYTNRSFCAHTCVYNDVTARSFRLYANRPRWLHVFHCFATYYEQVNGMSA